MPGNRLRVSQGQKDKNVFSPVKACRLDRGTTRKHGVISFPNQCLPVYAQGDRQHQVISRTPALQSDLGFAMYCLYDLGQVI